MRAPHDPQGQPSPSTSYITMWMPLAVGGGRRLSGAVVAKRVRSVM